MSSDAIESMLKQPRGEQLLVAAAAARERELMERRARERRADPHYQFLFVAEEQRKLREARAEPPAPHAAASVSTSAAASAGGSAEEGEVRALQPWPEEVMAAAASQLPTAAREEAARARMPEPLRSRGPTTSFILGRAKPVASSVLGGGTSAHGGGVQAGGSAHAHSLSRSGVGALPRIDSLASVTSVYEYSLESPAHASGGAGLQRAASSHSVLGDVNGHRASFDGELHATYTQLPASPAPAPAPAPAPTVSAAPVPALAGRELPSLARDFRTPPQQTRSDAMNGTVSSPSMRQAPSQNLDAAHDVLVSTPSVRIAPNLTAKVSSAAMHELFSTALSSSSPGKANTTVPPPTAPAPAPTPASTSSPLRPAGAVPTTSSGSAVKRSISEESGESGGELVQPGAATIMSRIGFTDDIPLIRMPSQAAMTAAPGLTVPAAAELGVEARVGVAAKLPRSSSGSVSGGSAVAPALATAHVPTPAPATAPTVAPTAASVATTHARSPVLHSAAKASATSPALVPARAPAPAPLPIWSVHQSSSTGLLYYHNRTTGATQWTEPSEFDGVYEPWHLEVIRRVEAIRIASKTQHESAVAASPNPATSLAANAA
ncbi:MAG: hypothetical protein EOO41_02620, partial [Methanobacteriota archaeon]